MTNIPAQEPLKWCRSFGRRCLTALHRLSTRWTFVAALASILSFETAAIAFRASVPGLLDALLLALLLLGTLAANRHKFAAVNFAVLGSGMIVFLGLTLTGPGHAAHTLTATVSLFGPFLLMVWVGFFVVRPFLKLIREKFFLA